MADSAGTFFQRGPNGQIPVGQSINGEQGAYGQIPLNGPVPEHVTNYYPGGHRSWDNNQNGIPGTTQDHSTRVGSHHHQQFPNWP